jgi:hypothetical protein
MILRRLTETTALLLLSITASAQLPSTGTAAGSGVLDGVYVQEHIPTKRVIQYTHLREADVMWSKRVWRTIDLREKQNHPLFYPSKAISDRMCLFDVIKYGALDEGSLTLYEDGGLADDQFRFPMLRQSGEVDSVYKARLLSKFGNTTLEPKFDPVTGTQVYDANGNPEYEYLTSPFEPQEILTYVI